MTRLGFIVVLSVYVVGCAGVTEPLGMEDPFAIPQPFRGVERNDEMIAQAIDLPALVIEAPQGMTPELGAMLRDQVVQAAQKRDIPALTAPTPRAWMLNAQAATIAPSGKAAGRETVISWQLLDDKGQERTRFPVKFAGTEEQLSATGVELLAQQTAASLEAVLAQAGRHASTAAPAVVRPVVRVGRIKGAPGDGNTALARALQSILPLKGVQIGSAKDKSAWQIEGTIKVRRGGGNQDVVTLTWRILDAKGKEAGTIAQENAVPRGRLSKSWAGIASLAAEAAAEGIAQLLQQIAQAESG